MISLKGNTGEKGDYIKGKRGRKGKDGEIGTPGIMLIKNRIIMVGPKGNKDIEYKARMYLWVFNTACNNCQVYMISVSIIQFKLHKSYMIIGFIKYNLNCDIIYK